MSLPACQERILSRIETTLRTCEPRLASRFAIFTRLNRDEALPRREQIDLQPWLKRLAGASRVSFRSFRQAWGSGSAPRRTRGRVAAGFRAAVLLPMVLIMMAAAVVAASLSANRACASASTRPAVAAVRWSTCTVNGAPAHGGRGAGTGTARTSTGISIKGTGITGTPH